MELQQTTPTADVGAPPPDAPPEASSFLAAPTPAAPPQAAAPAAPTNPYPVGDWRHGLPDELRNDDSIKVLNDVHTLAKSYVHARKAIGANKVALPSKHATEDDIQKFYDELGRPALDKYEVQPPKDAKFVDKDTLDKLKPLAHKVGIMPQQLNAILDFYEKDMSETVTKHEWR
jgi:hypothetical protein